MHVRKFGEEGAKGVVTDIVNISSVSGLRGAPTGVACCSSKHAVTGMTKAAADELGQFDIRVNSLHPGTVKADMSVVDGGMICDL